MVAFFKHAKHKKMIALHHYTGTAKKDYWTAKRIVFAVLSVYGLAVGVLLLFLCIKLFLSFIAWL